MGLSLLAMSLPTFPWLIIQSVPIHQDEHDPWLARPANNAQAFLLLIAAPFRPILELGRKLTFNDPPVEEELPLVEVD